MTYVLCARIVLRPSPFPRTSHHFLFLRMCLHFQALLTTDVLQGVPFLVLGNKIDLPLAASEPQLRDALGLHDTTGKEVTERVENQRPIEVFMCSVVRKMGYKDGACPVLTKLKFFYPRAIRKYLTPRSVRDCYSSANLIYPSFHVLSRFPVARKVCLSSRSPAHT